MTDFVRLPLVTEADLREAEKVNLVVECDQEGKIATLPSGSADLASLILPTSDRLVDGSFQTTTMNNNSDDTDSDQDSGLDAEELAEYEDEHKWQLATLIVGGLLMMAACLALMVWRVERGGGSHALVHHTPGTPPRMDVGEYTSMFDRHAQMPHHVAGQGPPAYREKYFKYLK